MKIYMNNAATSFPKPPRVAQAVSDALLGLPGAMHRGGIEDHDVFSAVRQALAPILGVRSPERIALGSNATWALNLGIFGLDLKTGDLVVTTRAEHNSVLRPLYALERRGIRVIYLDVDSCGRMDIDCWAEAMERYRPRLAVFTHASNVTGAVNPAAQMTAAAKAAGAAVLLDASQTLGCVPVEAERWGLDLVAFTGHKYLLGPQGTGGLWVRPGLELEPYLLGGTGIRSELRDMPREMPLHLEAGTGNEPSYHGLLAALDWQRDHPLDAPELNRKTEQLVQGLSLRGARVIDTGTPRTPVVSFTLPGLAVPEIGYLLQESCDIICRTGLHCAPGIFECLGIAQTVRLSLSRFTTDGEIQEVLQAVEDIRG